MKTNTPIMNDHWGVMILGWETIPIEASEAAVAGYTFASELEHYWSVETTPITVNWVASLACLNT